MKKDLRYICYTYMKEKSNKVDYEVLCDALAVTVGKVLPYLVKQEEQALKADLLKIVEFVYHANGSVRGKLAITEEDLQWLSNKYDEYCAYVGDTIKQFTLPIGCQAALQLHEVRNDAKLVYRVLHHVSKEDDVKVEPILFKFIGLLSNVACAMAFYANQLNGVEEIPFHTKSYILK